MRALLCSALAAVCVTFTTACETDPVEVAETLCTILGCPGGSNNNFGNAYNPTIAGVPVYCTSAPNGQPVRFVPNNALNDVGRAYWTQEPIIELNPSVLQQLPPKLQLFWYGHECGHHVLGHTLPGGLTTASESQADCWAIQIGKQQGLFTRAEVVAFGPYFQNNPGSPWGHLPGPQRSALFVQCFDSA
jgi:hypothetical protein